MNRRHFLSVLARSTAALAVAPLLNREEPVCAWCKDTGRRLYSLAPDFTQKKLGICDACRQDERAAELRGRTYILPPAEGWKEIHDAQREYDRLRSMELDMRLKFVRHVNGEFPARIDVLYGMQMVKPELAVRINA